jgi:hypothetical protein
MAQAHILPLWIVGEFLQGYRCRSCGTTPQHCALLPPRLLLNGTQAELVYPVRCPCGGSGALKIRMPTLLLGLVLLYVARNYLAGRGRNSQSKLQASPMPSAILRLVRQQYAILLRTPCDDEGAPLPEDTAAGGAGGAAPPPRGRRARRPRPKPRWGQVTPGTAKGDDAALLGLTPEEWRAMLRRMGFGEGDGTESTGP